MHWADRIAKEIVASGKFVPYHVDDMKTPSGYSHVGSLEGPVIHSMIFRALKDLGKEAVYTFVINDFDPADDLLPELKGKYEKYLGMPLRMAPSPDPKHKSMADLFGKDFVNSIQSLGVEAKILSSWDMYHEGKFDGVIKLALDNAEKIQDIYKKVSGSAKKEKGWLPFQVICENCQKLGTTRVYAWDGKEVSYRCEPNLVTWAKGCGHEGKISPFKGNGKLPWKVDWAAHWKVMGVTIEGAGKDHASAGGSYDIAMAICKEVFKYEKPYRLPYEFILIGGKKMSSSKGLGIKAHDIVKILPPQVGRFLFANHDIKSQSNFDPMGTMAIPDLFDEYDKAWEAYDKNADERLARIYVLSQITKAPEKEKGFFVPRFRDIANLLSQGFSLDEIVGKLNDIKKGKLDDSEMGIVEERVKYAKVWLESYAPDEFRFEMTSEVPEEAKKLTEEEKKYLGKVAKLVEENEEAEDLQTALYELTKEIGISTKDAFKAIYLSFIGKTHGPRAGMLLSKFGKEKVVERIKDVISGKGETVEGGKEKAELGGYYISSEVKTTFPGISFAYVIISGVKIKKSSSDLEELKSKVLASKKGLTTEDIGKISSISSYREMIRKTGVDYHSKRPSPDALLRRIALGKGLYTINTAVDSYNLAVIETGIGLGGFDYSKISEPISLRFSKDAEEVFLLGDEGKSFTEEGKLVYSDRDKILTIDLNYRDIDETKITLDTKDIILFADGGTGIAVGGVEKALKLGANYINGFCGGKVGEVHLIK